jgi:hypothetical protein
MYGYKWKTKLHYYSYYGQYLLGSVFFLSSLLPGARRQNKTKHYAIPVPVTHPWPSGSKFLRPKTNKPPDERTVVFYISVVQRIKGKT